MTASASVLPSRASARKAKPTILLHAVESKLADRIATNAAALRAALLARQGLSVPVNRLGLLALAQDMEAWAAELERDDGEARHLFRSAAA